MKEYELFSTVSEYERWRRQPITAKSCPTDNTLPRGADQRLQAYLRA